MDKKLIVHLRLYKGQQLQYNANGMVLNENLLYKVEYNSKMYDIAVIQGNLKIEYPNIVLERVLDMQGNEVKEIQFEGGHPVDLYAMINDDIDKMLKAKDNRTPEQKKLAEMEETLQKQAKLIELLSKGAGVSPKAKEEVKDPIKESKEEMDIDAIRAKYEALTGEKPHHRKTAKQLLARIENFNN